MKTSLSLWTFEVWNTSLVNFLCCFHLTLTMAIKGFQFSVMIFILSLFSETGFFDSLSIYLYYLYSLKPRTFFLSPIPQMSYLTKKTIHFVAFKITCDLHFLSIVVMSFLYTYCHKLEDNSAPNGQIQKQ